MLNNVDRWDSKRFQQSSTFDSTKFHRRPGIQPAVVSMDTDVDKSLGDRLVRTRKSNNVERGWRSSLTSFHIRDNKRMLNGC